MKKILKQLNINTKLIQALSADLDNVINSEYYKKFPNSIEQEKDVNDLTTKLVKLHDQRLKIIIDLEQALLTEKSELKKYLHDAKAA